MATVRRGSVLLGGIPGYATLPTLAGDLDLVVGGEDGRLKYFKNTGSSTKPEFEERTESENPFDGIDVGSSSAPALGDLDGDGTRKPRPSIDSNLSPHFRVSRRRPGPRRGRIAWLPQLHREHRDTYNSGVCFSGFFFGKQLLIFV